MAPYISNKLSAKSRKYSRTISPNSPSDFREYFNPLNSSSYPSLLLWTGETSSHPRGLSYVELSQSRASGRARSVKHCPRCPRRPRRPRPYPARRPHQPPASPRATTNTSTLPLPCRTAAASGPATPTATYSLGPRCGARDTPSCPVRPSPAQRVTGPPGPPGPPPTF